MLMIYKLQSLSQPGTEDVEWANGKPEKEEN